jgi:hypothetical protein
MRCCEADRQLWPPDATSQLNAPHNGRPIVPSINYCSSAQRVRHSGRAPVHAMQLPRSLPPCPILDKGKRSVSVGEGGNWLIVEIVRAALFELALLIAVIAVGASAARWWEGAPIAGAAIALISAIYCYRHALKERDRLVDQHFAADAD